MDGTGELFEAFAAELADTFKVVTVRYPGHVALGYEELTDIARRSLPVDEEFIILGESFSGPIAVTLASETPAGLRGLVLCSTFVVNPRPAFRHLAILAYWMPVRLVPGSILSYFLLGAAATLLLKSKLLAAVSQVSDAAFRARLRAVMTVNVAANLNKVKVPVLYLRAAQDRVVPPKAAAVIQRICPGAGVVVIDAPHCLLQVDARRAAGEVKQFAQCKEAARERLVDDATLIHPTPLS
jgi:pimeloyl-ACP methyl ester carboxylesterase